MQQVLISKFSSSCSDINWCSTLVSSIVL